MKTIKEQVQDIICNGIAEGEEADITTKKMMSLIAFEFVSLKLFYNKELSDAIRDVVINSPVDFEMAVTYLEGSNNIKMDAEIISYLSYRGFNKDLITAILLITRKHTDEKD